MNQSYKRNDVIAVQEVFEARRPRVSIDISTVGHVDRFVSIRLVSSCLVERPVLVNRRVTAKRGMNELH